MFTFNKSLFYLSLLFSFIIYKLYFLVDYTEYTKKFSDEKYWVTAAYKVKGVNLYKDFDYNSSNKLFLQNIIIEELKNLSYLSRKRNQLAYVIDYYCNEYPDDNCRYFLKKYLNKFENTKLSGRYVHMLDDNLLETVKKRITIPDRHYSKIILAKSENIKDDFVDNNLKIFAQTFFKDFKNVSKVDNIFLVKNITKINIPQGLDISIHSNKEIDITCANSKNISCGFKKQKQNNNFLYIRKSETIFQEESQPEVIIKIQANTELDFKI